MITIAETPPYSRKADKLLSTAERSELISYLSSHPKAGVLIEGSGGVRKLRWSRGSSGKSGGARVIYYYHSDAMPLYLLTLFAKNEKENISKEEKVILAKLIKQLIAFWRC
jgi:hypothetical protein